MKTLLSTQKSTFKTLGFLSVMLLCLFAFNPSYAQTETKLLAKTTTNERTIKGLVSNEDGPLPGANIILKGTKVGTVTNEDGKFTFPKKLKTGDILIFSYLGFETQEVAIKDNTTFIKLTLSPDLVEMMGALDTDKPYKSKRKN